jgi:hypothetical protein
VSFWSTAVLSRPTVSVDDVASDASVIVIVTLVP